ncbi:MAG: hypothetical protein AAFR79_17665 [Pseudomonadota bacterium]
MAIPDYKAEKKDLDGKRGRNAKKWPSFEKAVEDGKAAATQFVDRLQTDLIMIKGFHEHADDLYEKWAPMAEQLIKLQADLKKAKGNTKKAEELNGKIDALHKKAKGVRDQISKNVEKVNAHLQKTDGRITKIKSLLKG